MLVEILNVISMCSTAMVVLQIKDVEASVQDAVIDHAEEFILSRAYVAVSLQNSVHWEACIAAVQSLSSILSLVSEPELNAQLSLSQAVAAMRAKGRLKGDKAAKGLQNIIGNAGTLLLAFHLSYLTDSTT